MSDEEYMKMLYNFNHTFDGKTILIIQWSNGLKVKCLSVTGVAETDIEPDEEEYAGEYDAYVEVIEYLEPAKDDSITIYKDNIEICMKSIPEEIALEDGTVLWARGR